MGIPAKFLVKSGKSTKISLLWVVALLVAILCLPAMQLAWPQLQITYWPGQLLHSTRADQDKLNGIYPTEVDPRGEEFNWTSPNAVFMFDIESSKPLNLMVEIRSAAIAGGPDKPVAVLVNGLHVGELHPDPQNSDFQLLSLKFTPASIRSTVPPDRYPLKIELVSVPFKPAGDSRELGTMVKSVTLDKEEAWSVIAKRMWLFWLMPGLGLIALALYLIGWRFRIALAGYLAALLCLGGAACMGVAIALLLSIGVIDLLTFPVFLVCSAYLGLLGAIAGGVMVWKLPPTRKFVFGILYQKPATSGEAVTPAPTIRPGYLRLVYSIPRYYRSIVTAPEKVYLGLGLVFGLLFILAIPPFQVPDEFSHFARAYGIVEGNLIARSLDIDVPASSVAFYHSVEYLNFQSEQKISPLSLASSLGMPLNPADKTPFLTNAAGYPPVSYFPEVLGMGIGRLFNASPLLLLYLGRIGNLLASVFLIFFAIKITPVFKWVFLAVALTPMLFQQMVSLSADSFTNTIDLVFVAVVLAYAFDPNRRFTNRNFLLALVLAILVALSKQAYFMLLLLFFLIPVRKAGGFKKYITLGGLLLLAGLVSLIIWSMLSAGLSFATVHTHEISPADQLNFVLSDPVGYLQIILDNVFRKLKNLLDLAIGAKLGWLDTPLDPFLLFAIECSLLFLALTDKNEAVKFNRTGKIVVLAVALLTVFSIFSSSYIALNPVATKDLTALQGRYFIPILPLVLLLFYNQRIKFNISMVRFGSIILCGSIVFLSLILSTLTNRYYADVFTGDKVLAGIDNGTLSQEVLPGKPIVQDFKCSVERLEDISILAGPDNERDPAADFEVVLREGANQIFQHRMSGFELRNNKWVSLGLPEPLENCAGRNLSLTISSEDAKPDSGLKFWSYEKYYEGQLSVSNQALPDKSIGLVLNGHSYDLI